MAEGDSSGLPKLVLTRVFDAPRALVFKAWTDPRHVARWWGPKGFTNPVCELDARPGGAIKILMRGPDGSEYPMTGQFRDVVPPERLVFVSQAIEDETGIPRLQVETTVTFAERGGKTRSPCTRTSRRRVLEPRRRSREWRSAGRKLSIASAISSPNSDLWGSIWPNRPSTTPRS